MQQGTHERAVSLPGLYRDLLEVAADMSDTPKHPIPGEQFSRDGAGGAAC